MKNHLIILENYCQKGKLEEALDYIRKIKEPVSKVKKFLTTGNDIIDIILNYKLSVAEQKGIVVETETEILQAMIIEENDLCAILANLIDNAINACCEVEEGKTRWINIKIKSQGNVIMFCISNVCSASPKKNKKKQALHGYGQISIEQRVKKYKGNIRTNKKEMCMKQMLYF